MACNVLYNLLVVNIKVKKLTYGKVEFLSCYKTNVAL